MKKVIVGGLHHESNTFNPILTDWDDVYVRRGDEMLSPIRKNSIGGVVQTLSDAGYCVIPTVHGRAVPNGIWKEEVYTSLKDEILKTIKETEDLDGICLAIHGSMRVENIGEAEGDLLKAIRKIAPSVPLIASLDMHATITEEMMKYADGFVGYKCAPHTDTYETGAHAARMLIDTLEHGAKPVMEMVRVPMIVAGEKSETNVEPMLSLMKDLRELEKSDSIMAASYLMGFPWADTAPNTICALVVADRSREKARALALDLAKRFWKRKEEFVFYNDTRAPKEALEAALEKCKTAAPAVISDSGDNPTAGSSADVTNFLKLMIAHPGVKALDPPALYQYFYDPELTERAFEYTPGSRFIGKLGASFDKERSTPVVSEMSVKALKKDWDGNGVDIALLGVGGVDVVISSSHVGAYDPEMMRALGVEPETRKIIVMKLGYLEPEIRAISNYSVMALTDGSTNEALENIEYRKLQRPVYPLDRDVKADWEQ